MVDEVCRLSSLHPISPFLFDGQPCAALDALFVVFRRQQRAASLWGPTSVSHQHLLTDFYLLIWVSGKNCTYADVCCDLDDLLIWLPSPAILTTPAVPTGASTPYSYQSRFPLQFSAEVEAVLKVYLLRVLSISVLNVSGDKVHNPNHNPGRHTFQSLTHCKEPAHIPAGSFTDSGGR